jgi:hypothetical protein
VRFFSCLSPIFSSLVTSALEDGESIKKHYNNSRKTLTLTHRLRAFENRVVRGIFGPKRNEVRREWRKLHIEELRILYLSPNIIRQIKSRRMRWAGYVARMGYVRKVYRVLVGKPEGKIPLGGPKR